MGTQSGTSPTEEKIQVIGLQATNDSPGGLGVYHLLIRPLSDPRNRSDSQGFAPELLTSGQPIELSANKSYRAFRVSREYATATLFDRETDAAPTPERVSTHPLLKGYTFDESLQAFYRIFNDEKDAELEQLKWIMFIEGAFEGLLYQKVARWKRLDALLECLMYATSPTATPEARMNYNSLRLAVTQIRTPDRTDNYITKSIQCDHPEEATQNAVLLQAIFYRGWLQQNWVRVTNEAPSLP